MKTCLVKIPTFEAPRSLSYFGSVPSLGLAYVAGAARGAGHEVCVVDAPGEAINRYGSFRTSVADLRMHGLSAREIVERIAPDTEVIGLTNMFLHEWNFLRELIPMIKDAHPRATTVVGGENASAWWSHMLAQCPAIDICVLGEGEEKFTDLLAAIDKGSGLGDVASIAFRDSGRPTRTESRQRIVDIDSIDWPAWDLFPTDAYLDHEFGSGVNRGRSLPMLSSRGCPYQCTFCSSPEMWTTRYYARDPEQVADEVEHYIDRYSVTNINFNDLTAVLTKKWIAEFCGIVQARELHFSWQLPSGTRSEVVDREVAELLYNSGCRNFGYAPESGSPRMLKIIKKKVKIPALIESLKGSLEAGLNTHGNVIIGFPQETARDLWHTYKLLVRMAWVGLHTVSVMVFAPYPGCEEFVRLSEQGAIEVDDGYVLSTLLRSGSSVKSYNPRFGERALIAIQMFFLVSFFALQYLFRPIRAFTVISNLIHSKQESVMDQFLTAKLKQFRRNAN